MATRTYVLIEDEVDPSDPPVYRLARLAVDNSVKGYGLGAYLLIERLRRVVDASISVGGIGCAVDAKDDNSKRFYEKFGFVAIDAAEGGSLAL